MARWQKYELIALDEVGYAIFSGSGPQSRGQAVVAILSKLHWGKRKEDCRWRTAITGQGHR